MSNPSSPDHMIPRATIGMANEEDMFELDELRKYHIEKNLNEKQPQALAEVLELVIDRMEELHVKARDNNAILSQLLIGVEERINKRIDTVKQELIDLINSKLVPVSPPPVPPVPPAVATNKRASFAQPSGGLAGIFDEVKPMEETSVAPIIVMEPTQIYPLPGFVIKTRKLVGSKDKVFINVFHHDYIEYEPAEAAKISASSGVDNRPYMVMGETTNALDKDGHNCITFNIGVSSEYFKHPNPKVVDFNITTPSSIHKVSF